MRLMSQLTALCLGAATLPVQAHPIVADAMVAQYEPDQPTQAMQALQAVQPVQPVQAVQYQLQPQPDAVSSGATRPVKAADSKIVPSPVPEPVHYKLLLIGIVLLLFFGHRSTDSKPWRKN